MSDDYYITPPKNQKFYRFIANMMSYFSVGTRTAWGYEKSTKFQIFNSHVMSVFAPWCAISQIVYLYINYSDLTFDILSVIFSIFPATCIANVNIYSAKLKSYERISTKFLQKFHIHNIYAETKSEFVKQMLITMERITRWTSFYYIFFYFFNCFAWLVMTSVNNYNNKELVLNRTVMLQTPLFMWMPFDYRYNYRNWLIVHLINCYTVLSGVISMMIYQIINYMFIFNLLCHIRLLKHSLMSISGNLSNEEVRSKLCKIVDHNNFIIDVFDDVQHAFGVVVAAYYLQNLFANSFVMYQLMYGGKENLMLYVGMITSYTGGPIIMSFILEEIKRQTDNVPNLVYNMPWEEMSVSNQKTVLLILQRSQILMEFKALGGLRTGVGLMMSILKTTFSYYMMLESSIGNKE